MLHIAPEALLLTYEMSASVTECLAVLLMTLSAVGCQKMLTL